MANEARSFGLAIALVLVGLAVMLYGVTLNHGAALNEVITAGGAIIVVGIAVMTFGVIRVDVEHAE